MQSNTPISFFLNKEDYTKKIKNDFVDWSLSQMKSKTNSPEMIGNELLVCEKYKLLYASCSKNACSTVKAFLASLTKAEEFSNASPHYKHLTSLRGITEFKKERAYDMLFGDSAFRFTISRNPYDRAISCFLNRVDNLGLETYDNAEFAAETFKKNRVQILRWKISQNKEAVQDNRKIDFSDFIEFICQQDFRDMDRHWASQADSLHPELIMQLLAAARWCCCCCTLALLLLVHTVAAAVAARWWVSSSSAPVVPKSNPPSSARTLPSRPGCGRRRDQPGGCGRQQRKQWCRRAQSDEVVFGGGGLRRGLCCCGRC